MVGSPGLAFEKTGISVSVGYGLLTHYYNLSNNLVPKEDYVISTIYDYLANYLASSKELTIHSSSAQSFGYYNLEKNEFYEDKLSLLGVKEETLPDVTASPKKLGTFKCAKVYSAIGDNQASYMGATNGKKALLLNFGTGAQISISSDNIIKTESCEVRSYIKDDYLVVGASICGGKAFEALARFYQSITDEPLDTIYRKLTSIKYTNTDVEFKPLFLGTRKDSNVKASVSGLTLSNFNIENLTISLLEGMVDELYSFYQDMKDIPFECIIGSGNGIRKNKLLAQIVEKKFNQKVLINEIEEEAAYGATLYFRR